MGTEFSAVSLFSAPPTPVEETIKQLAAETAQRCAAQANEPKRPDMRRLPPLEAERKRMVEQLTWRQEVVRTLTPEVKRLQADVARLKAARRNLADQKLATVYEADFVRQLSKLENMLANESERLETSEKLVDSWAKLLAEWDAANGDELEALRKLQRSVDALNPQVRAGFDAPEKASHGF